MDYCYIGNLGLQAWLTCLSTGVMSHRLYQVPKCVGSHAAKAAKNKSYNFIFYKTDTNELYFSLRHRTYHNIHYSDVIMSAMASQITSLTIVYSTIYSGGDQRKYPSSVSLAFVRGIHRCPVNSPHTGPVTRKCFHLMTSSWQYFKMLHSSFRLMWAVLPGK